MSKLMNEASWDRIVRVILGIVLIYIGFSDVVSGGLGVFIGIIGFVPLVTGLAGFCPIYALLKYRTDRRPIV
jgi:hypothetical protein